MPEQKGTREILLALAEHLPEKVLRDILPAVTPERVREVLTRLAGGKPSAGRPRQTSIFPDNKETSLNNPCYLYSDGASRGNPGEAGAGAVLIGSDGSELGTHSSYLGQCTNNVAEYRALLAGLELAEQSGCRTLHIRLDSELIVQQIKGAYKVKNEQLKPLFDKVRSRLAKLKQWDIRHVPRRENARADELANRGIDNREQEIGAGA